MLPRFRTKRLLLRPRTMRDFADCLAMDRDPDVTRHVAGPWGDPERHERFLRQRIRADFGPGLGYWTVATEGAPDTFLGWVMLIPEDGTGPEVEIGWRFCRRAWGRGYATEAARPVLAHGFRTLGLARIVAAIAPGNAASIRVAEKIGLRPAPGGQAYAATCDDHAGRG
ncbi:GNAT family N-acetyltransferase [Microvirga pudoricolor]|uniref:GNAT family N-acetyltransferase n=1 Tax=Microvirga pudoricolor TaxID=2778729 RepID=UPI00194E94DB|nr:GNAT family N-acetyltransferase [Microvirga pudoricolor]MBM6594112.1 GNAT family N-acetyltransferase [Microvirga pudoricolor]